MLITPEFLDASCKAGPLDRGWYLIKVTKFGFFTWQVGRPETVYKIDNIEMWLEEKSLEESNPEEITTCLVRTVIEKKARIFMPERQNVEVWLNIVIPETLDGKVRVEAYTDQTQALEDAEEELTSNKEVHTKRITVKIP